MSHLWPKKNPFMSRWPTSANEASNCVRAGATAATQREVAAAQTHLDIAWGGAVPAKSSQFMRRRLGGTQP